MHSFMIWIICYLMNDSEDAYVLCLINMSQRVAIHLYSNIVQPCHIVL